MKALHLLPILFLLIVPKGFSQDTIIRHDNFKVVSKALGEARTINVWTPPGYAAAKSPFPVLYMLDGGMNEDFPHVANTVDALITAGKIWPLILVGIENTQRRRDLTGPTQVKEDKEIAPVVGGSGAFRTFIKDELFPEISKRYRTTKEKAIIGESLAGLFITETFLQYPDMFDSYIAIDPSLWWNDKHLIKTAKECLAKFPKAKNGFWSAGSQDMSGLTNELAAIINSVGLSTIAFHYEDAPNEGHSTIFKAVKEKALIWAFGK